uniref:Uncharacterized protein n=1 Tax=Chromera velia CCMP2878 TaxID=1169474 RepID=A0A0G4HXI3_9ALVE|mmetsp:Transcript_1630/g.3350  ORF Transcript_1630/g.3350 Transcript_1630/m.3350 type:complete len:291 (-) Transcript_1630:488-1360(-)|eukprot:Cvel_1500.t1-p1 / transcript=Cvel_1500.t1 / gene=Cvel_1500 / organism=Chromera_velia_CCMP2878 / gene_product=hypothetical protein / transcript_product=hypothetical protein / location=Cvel_scaffold52:125130-128658(-) / protein_length=290 / sequence_SO=supercontig / SO=protein_coding / is_pseudo=false
MPKEPGLAGGWLTLNRANKADFDAVVKVKDQDMDEAATEEFKKPQKLESVWWLWEELWDGHEGSPHKEEHLFKMGPVSKTSKIETIQDFWALWRHLPQPSHFFDGKKCVKDDPETRQQIGVVKSLLIFKEDIEPNPDNEFHKTGGILSLDFAVHTPGLDKETKEIERLKADEYWNNMGMAALGHAIECSEFVTGIRLIDRTSGFRDPKGLVTMELWFADPQSDEWFEKLKHSVERVLSTRINGMYDEIRPVEVRRMCFGADVKDRSFKGSWTDPNATQPSHDPSNYYNYC